MKAESIKNLKKLRMMDGRHVFIAKVHLKRCVKVLMNELMRRTKTTGKNKNLNSPVRCWLRLWGIHFSCF